MTDVTRILSGIAQGDSAAAERLLPLVYEELRSLASAKLAKENPGHTLQATALVHEAYLRLVDTEKAQTWDSRGHFFAAAAEAMRRILVENARRKLRLRHGGQLQRHEIDCDRLQQTGRSEELVAIDEALERLTLENPPVAQLVKLRYFAGFTVEEAASILQVNVRTAHRYWAYARVWLYNSIKSASADDTGSPNS